MIEDRQAPQSSVLADIRRALGRTSTIQPTPLEPFVEPVAAEESEALVMRFANELSAVRGAVYRAGPDSQPGEEIAAQIAAVCRPYGLTEVALSGSALLAEMNLAEQLAAQGLTTFRPADAVGLDHDELVARLARSGAGVTAADYAIAETGTIALSSDEAHALLVSLLPAIHFALLRPAQISASLGEVLGKLAVERSGRADPTRSVSFITGPSRTSDVELTLSIGVHGPKELHVIII